MLTVNGIKEMAHIMGSETYKTVMYLLFILGVFFTVGVTVSHGGIFGEVFVPQFVHFGELCLLIATILWCGLRFSKGFFYRDK